jgi:flagellar hook-length control protein FliK
MPTVSTGGRPLTAIDPTAAMASRQTTPPDSRFADLLFPTAAKPDKSGSARGGLPVPVNLPTDQSKGSIQPPGTASVDPSRNGADGPETQPPQVALTIEPGSSQPAPRDSDEHRPQHAMRSDAGARVTLQPPATSPDTGIAVAACAVDQTPRPTGSSCAQPDTSKHFNEVTLQPDDWLAATTGSSKSAEQNTAVAPPPIPGDIVAVAELLIKSAVGEVPAPGTTDSSENVASGNSATPVEAGARTHTSPMPQVGAIKVSRVIATATVGDETAGKHGPAVLHSNAADSTTAASAAVGAHAALQSQPGVAISSYQSRAGTVAATPPPAQDFATAQPGEATSSAIMPMSAIPQASADSSTVRRVGTVAAATTDPSALAVPQSDQTGLQPDAAAMPANWDRPVAASTLQAGNGFAIDSLQQNPPRDERSDTAATPLYNAGFATSTAPTSASVSPPIGLPSGPPTGSAMQQVAMHVAQSLNDTGKTVTVELHPAELGRVEIHFSFHSDGMNVRLIVDRPETFEAFSHDRSGLQQQLAQAGVNLGGGGLDLRLGQQQPDQSGSHSSGRSPRVTLPTAQPDAAPATLWISNSLLDILA